MIGALAHPGHHERPLRRGEIGRGFERVLPIDVHRPIRGIVLELLHERRDKIERLVDAGVLPRISTMSR